jgi:hypothetical protein
MCLECMAFSLTECQIFIATGQLGESKTIVYNIDTRWHHLLIVLCSEPFFSNQTQMSIALYIYGVNPKKLAPMGDIYLCL